jgi:hypothetical protein
MRIIQSLTTTLLAASLILSAKAQQQSTEFPLDAERPLFKIDLRRFGYEEWTVRKTQHFIQTYWINSLGFTDNGNIAVAWLTLDNSSGPKLKEGQAPQPEPAHLHAVFLDATNGQKKALQEWPVPSFPVHFLSLRDREFLICTGDSLRLFSSNFEVLSTRDSKPSNGGAGCTSPFAFARTISPSSRSIFLSYQDGRTYKNQLLDSRTFASVASWADARGWTEFADHWLVGTCGEPKTTCIRRIDQDWKPIQVEKQSYNREVRFLNDSALLVRTKEGVSVYATDGSILFTLTLPKDRFVGQIVTSTGGERFAIIADRMRGLTNQQLDMYPFQTNDSVFVYSIPEQRIISEVKIKGTSPWTPWNWHSNQVALSPDGTLLAIESSDTLKIYKLPGDSVSQK